MKKNASNIIIGIDATRNRSGGAIAHLKGILEFKPFDYGIKQVHLWAYSDLLRKVENKPWLIKHNVEFKHSSLILEILWQLICLPFIAKKSNIDVMFNTDAGSFCTFQPSVTLSQDMLSFEKGEIKRYYKFPYKFFRLLILRYIQLHRLKNSNTAIFLTKYAKESIGKLIKFKNYKIISHGINDEFKINKKNKKILSKSKKIKCIYISNVAPYKHQWNIVEAIYLIRKKLNRNLEIDFIGGINKICEKKFLKTLDKFDPKCEFVKTFPFVKNNLLPKLISNSDIFIFASSCENLPITLLEGMSTGIPIICSDRGPMPEILKDGGIYFDPEKIDSIVDAVVETINNDDRRLNISKKSKIYSSQFSWESCANLTWETLANSIRN